MILDLNLRNTEGALKRIPIAKRESISPLVIAARKISGDRRRNEGMDLNKEPKFHHGIDRINIREEYLPSARFDFSARRTVLLENDAQRMEMPLANDKKHEEEKIDPVSKFFMNLGAKILLYIANGFWPKF